MSCESKYFSVCEINSKVKNCLAEEFFDYIKVCGEVSSCKIYGNSTYLSLKDVDSSSIISGCIWGNDVTGKSYIEIGKKVIVKCKINCYVKNGTYQLNIIKVKLKDNTVDNLSKLKTYYEKLGYFTAEKNKIALVDNICIITAETGAAIKDILHVFSSKNYRGNITIKNVQVQGVNCPKSVESALKIADSENYNLILVTRGGGSKEDLYGFNDKILVEQIYNMKTPVMTAIGHEIDTLLIDYVSDMAVSTPTRAAEIISDIFLECYGLEKAKEYLNWSKNKIQCDINNYRNKVINIQTLLPSYSKVCQNLIAQVKENTIRMTQKILADINDYRNLVERVKITLEKYNNSMHHIILYNTTINYPVISKEEYDKFMKMNHKFEIIFRDGIVGI